MLLVEVILIYMLFCLLKQVICLVYIHEILDKTWIEMHWCTPQAMFCYSVYHHLTCVSFLHVGVT